MKYSKILVAIAAAFPFLSYSANINTNSASFEAMKNELMDRVIVSYPEPNLKKLNSFNTIALFTQEVKVLNRKVWKVNGISMVHEEWQLSEPKSPVSIKSLSKEINQVFPFIKSVSPSVKAQTHSIELPNDRLVGSQWHLGPKGANVIEAWSKFNLSGRNTIIGVGDNGVLEHTELSNNKFSGRGFLTDAKDNDPNKLADSTAPSGCFNEKNQTSDAISYHGIEMSNVAAARARNNYGGAGVAYDSNTIHAKVLGQCGGSLLDVASGVFWLAGGEIQGVPANTKVASVINLSLGAISICPDVLQSAINFATSKGIPVVASMGNLGGNLTAAPASCKNTISVMASSIDSDLAFYSNFAGTSTIAAPGGGSSKDVSPRSFANPIITSSNSGGSFIGGDLEETAIAGTSPAAAVVSGAIALVKEKNPNIGPFALSQLMQQSASPWRTDGFCGRAPTLCAPGIINVEKMIERADNFNPPSVLVAKGPEVLVKGGSTVEFSVEVDPSIPPESLSYQWESGYNFHRIEVVEGQGTNKVKVRTDVKVGDYLMQVKINQLGNPVGAQQLIPYQVSEVGAPIVQDAEWTVDSSIDKFSIRSFPGFITDGGPLQIELIDSPVPQKEWNFLVSEGFVSIPTYLFTKRENRFSYVIIDQFGNRSNVGNIRIVVSNIPEEVAEQPPEGDNGTPTPPPVEETPMNPNPPPIDNPEFQMPPEEKAPEQATSPGGGGGSMNLFGLVGLFAVLRLFKKRS